MYLLFSVLNLLECICQGDKVTHLETFVDHAKPQFVILSTLTYLFEFEFNFKSSKKYLNKTCIPDANF